MPKFRAQVENIETHTFFEKDYTAVDEADLRHQVRGANGNLRSYVEVAAPRESSAKKAAPKKAAPKKAAPKKAAPKKAAARKVTTPPAVPAVRAQG